MDRDISDPVCIREKWVFNEYKSSKRRKELGCVYRCSALMWREGKR